MAMTDEERKRRRRERERERRAYRRENHLCLRCGKPLPEWDDRHTQCDECIAVQKTWKAKRDIARKHGYTLTKEVRRLMAKYPDMPPTAYGKMRAREYWEAQGVKTT